MINASTTFTIHFHFPMRKSLNIFPFIARNLTFASNKQRQERNILATSQRGKPMGAYGRSKSLQFVKPQTQMQTLTRMDKVDSQ